MSVHSARSDVAAKPSPAQQLLFIACGHILHFIRVPYIIRHIQGKHLYSLCRGGLLSLCVCIVTLKGYSSVCVCVCVCVCFGLFACFWTAMCLFSEMNCHFLVFKCVLIRDLLVSLGMMMIINLTRLEMEIDIYYLERWIHFVFSWDQVTRRIRKSIVGIKTLKVKTLIPA